jgi:hypothetical protein
MLCTFTTKDGALVVSSEDIRAIEDTATGCQLRFALGGVTLDRAVHGTAVENRDRIQQEELDMIARVEVHRYETTRALQAGYPVPPIKRGKQ